MPGRHRNRLPRRSARSRAITRARGSTPSIAVLARSSRGHRGRILYQPTSYGAQKMIGELLLNDYLARIRRRGDPVADHRGPSRQRTSVFGLFSGIIRELLAGIEVASLLDDSVRHWVASPASATGRSGAATMDDRPWGAALHDHAGPFITVGEMIAW